jgi:HPt (histidine-containing phosphotransfer) domain-containing protein
MLHKIIKFRVKNNWIVKKIINLDYIEEIAAGDRDFIREIIDTFILQIPMFTGNMKNYLHNGQFDLLAREAHTAKSSVILFGLDHLAGRLKEFQLLALKQEKTESYPDFIHEFEETCLRAVKEMNDLLEERE